MLGTTEIKTKTKSLPSKNSRPSRRDRKMNKEVQNWILYLITVVWKRHKEMGEKKKNRGRLQRKGDA